MKLSPLSCEYSPIVCGKHLCHHVREWDACVVDGGCGVAEFTANHGSCGPDRLSRRPNDYPLRLRLRPRGEKRIAKISRRAEYKYQQLAGGESCRHNHRRSFAA